MKKILFIFAVLVLITSCTTVKYPYLVGTDDNDTEVYKQRGNYTLQLEKFDNSVTVTVEGLDIGEKDVTAVYVGIENESGDVYNFADSNIEIFGGNKDTGEWTSLGLWDANAYYEKVVLKEEKARALAILSVVLGVFSSVSSDDSTRISTGIVSEGLGMAASASAGDAIASSYFSSSSWLKDNMLYSSAVRENKTYSGIVLFEGRKDSKKAFPDYKIAFKNNDTESHEFVLQRSDRASVINPWLDKPFKRSTFALAFNPLLKMNGLIYIYDHPASIGLYSGFMVDATMHANFSWPLGVTFKPLPNTWLMAGGNIYFGNERQGIAPQLGVNVVTNWINAFVMADYNFKQKIFGLSFGFGYAFTHR